MTLRANDAFCWAKQSTAVGLTYATPRTFAATSTGASDGTEIPCSTLAADMSGNDDLVGYWVEVVTMSTASGVESGAPVRRPIVQYDHSAKRVHVWPLGGQVADGDQFALIVPPHKWLSEDTGGSDSLISDSTRNEADDDLNGTTQEAGYYVEVIKADNATTSDMPRALNWTNSTHDLSTATALTGNTAIGDLFELWKFPSVDGLIEFTHPRVERSFVTGTTGAVQSVAGLREGSGQQVIPFRGPGTGRVGSANEVDVALGAVFSTASASDYTTSTCTTTSVGVTGTGAAAGEAYMTEDGDVFVATAVDGDGSMTPSPTLRSAPSANQTVYGARRYTPCDAVQYAVSVKQWRGKEVVEYGWGGVPTVQLGLTRGEVPKVTVGWQFAHHSGRLTKDDTNTALSRAWRPIRSSVNERAIGMARVNIGGVEFEARSVNVDMGLQYQQRTNLSAPDESDGFLKVPGDPTLTIECWLDSDTKDQLRKFEAGEAQTILVQSGKGYGNPGVEFFWAYKVEYTGMPFADEGGVTTVQLPCKVIEDRTETTLPRYAWGYF